MEQVVPILVPMGVCGTGGADGTEGTATRLMADIVIRDAHVAVVVVDSRELGLQQRAVACSAKRHGRSLVSRNALHVDIGQWTQRQWTVDSGEGGPRAGRRQGGGRAQESATKCVRMRCGRERCMWGFVEEMLGGGAVSRQ